MPHKIKQAAKLLKKGKKITKVAEKIGISPNLARFIKDKGVKKTLKMILQ